MEDKKINLESVNNIYKNAHIALQSISDVSKEVQDPGLKQELLDEYEGYEKIIGEISSYMAEHGHTPQDVNIMKKAMLWTSVKLNALADGSKSHIAEMMIKGTVMGITELTEMLNRGQENIDKEILDYAEKLKNLEESYEEKLKTFL